MRCERRVFMKEDDGEMERERERVVYGMASTRVERRCDEDEDEEGAAWR